MAIFGFVCPLIARIGIQTPKTKISTYPGKVFPTGLYLGMGGFDHFLGGFLVDLGCFWAVLGQFRPKTVKNSPKTPQIEVKTP
jgi:hypothetical protein